MSLTFYFSPMSTASITELVFAELGVPHEVVKIDLKAGDQKKPEFLKINPNGRVPAIVHEGQPIFESVAITMYLGETFGTDKGLYPAAGPQRGAAMSWLVWTHVTLNAALLRFQQHTSSYFPDDQKNAKAGEAAKASVQENLKIVDAHLSTHTYFVGQTYSLVDAHIGSYMGYLAMCGFDLKQYPAIAAWYERFQARPAVQQTMAKNGHA